jgi:hypothetical protein
MHVLGEVLFEHTPPLWLIAAALFLALAVVGVSFRRYLPLSALAVGLAVLRLAFFALLAGCLLLPVMKRLLQEIIPPRFVVAVDTSASMALAPVSNAPSRWATTQSLLGQPWTRALPEDCRIELYPFAAEVGPQAGIEDAARLVPDGPATHLHAALRKIADRYKGQNLAGLLLLSDGLDTVENSDDWVEEPWPCPVFTVALDPAQAWEEQPDLRVENVNTPRRVVVGWDTRLTAVVSGQGPAGQAVTVQLLENDRSVEEIPTQLTVGGGSREVVFHLKHPEVGTFTYRVQIPPLPREQQTNDNAYAVTVQVVDTKNRLLYVEGVPRWESKYLVRVLRANRNVTPLIFIRGPRNQFLTYGEREGMTLDLTDAQMARYKIVILGDLDATALDPARAASLVRFAESGGSLVLLGGPAAWGPDGFAATELRKVLPAQRDPAQAAETGQCSLGMSDEGLAHPAFAATRDAWTHLPPVLSVFAGATAAAGASALVTAQTADGRRAPLIVSQRYGQGKVVAILTDSLWRWQLDPNTDKLYGQFWNQMLQWLSPEETEMAPYELDLFADTDQLFMGEPIRLSARVGGEPEGAEPPAVACELEGPDGRRVPLAMDRQTVVTASGNRFSGYGVEYRPILPGLHRAAARAQIGGTRVESGLFSFYVKPYTPESNPRPANAELLSRLSAASKGRHVPPAELDAALRGLKVERREEQRITFSSLWNNPPVLACLIALLALEWTLRRMRNMA